MNENRVRVLPIHVANKISAGEVVERPASVVKELVENAIDAGASNIRISIVSGGKKLISVQDDGCGMVKEDALLSLERQATSKILDESDIENITTLGFRGEAIPSIASVSRLSMTTRRKNADEGFFLQVNAGILAETRSAGCPPGTVIEVKDLFCNVPARLKFLKSNMTEESHIKHVYTVHALSHPQISFSLYIDGREAGNLPPASSLQERIHDLFGAEFLEAALPISLPSEEGRNKIKISGFIERPNLSTPTRKEQYIFVNSRPATAPTINYALRESYPRKQGDIKPSVILFIDTDASMVDVNVHPMKREVRFRDNASIRNAVAKAVKTAIFTPTSSSPSTSSSTSPSTPLTSTSTSTSTPLTSPSTPPSTSTSTSPSTSTSTSTPPSPSPSTSTSPSSPPPRPTPTPTEVELKLSDDGDSAKPWRWFNILAQTQNGYVLLETDAGIVTINPAAARERIAYERMRDLKSPSQPLLIPETISLSPADTARIKEAIDILHSMGFSIEEFGRNTFKIDALPQIAANIPAESILATISSDLAEPGSRRGGDRWKEEIIAKSIARSFAGAKLKMSPEGAKEMVEELCSCKMPYVCPRGKPVMIFTSNRELDRKFDRR
jgi:DNA mismatch repair protein MutL